MWGGVARTHARKHSLFVIPSIAKHVLQCLSKMKCSFSCALPLFHADSIGEVGSVCVMPSGMPESESSRENDSTCVQSTS